MNVIRKSCCGLGHGSWVWSSMVFSVFPELLRKINYSGLPAQEDCREL